MDEHEACEAGQTLPIKVAGRTIGDVSVHAPQVGQLAVASTAGLVSHAIAPVRAEVIILSRIDTPGRMVFTDRVPCPAIASPATWVGCGPTSLWRVTYPVGEPYDSGLMPSGDGHQIYWEVYGSPAGKPAVVLHGGPGSGATPWWRQFFDPSRYRVVLFDQRGCGRSLPNACDDLAALDNNTTAHLVADMEMLREHLGIDRWLLFGASWGSTLGLSYAVEHPERVTEMVLWALVTTRRKDIHWLTYVMGEIYPEDFDQLLGILPPGIENIPAAVHSLLRSPDPDVCDAAARAWCAWEDRIGTLSGPVIPQPRSLDPRRRLGFARLVTHYFGNCAFQPDDAITGRLGRIVHVPAYFLRGRLDIASPLRSACEVAQQLPNATLDIVEADAHGAGDDTVQRLVAALDRFARQQTLKSRDDLPDPPHSVSPA